MAQASHTDHSTDPLVLGGVQSERGRGPEHRLQQAIATSQPALLLGVDRVAEIDTQVETVREAASFGDVVIVLEVVSVLQLADLHLGVHLPGGVLLGSPHRDEMTEA